MNPIRAYLTFCTFVCCSMSLCAQSIPEAYHGGWHLDGYMRDGVLESPKTHHLLLLDPRGTLVRAKMIGTEWEKEEPKNIKIEKNGQMFLVEVDGVDVLLGVATITSDGKLHLIDQDQKRHLVYSKFDPITIK